MKVLITIIYLISFVAFIVASQKYQAMTLSRIRGEKVNKLLMYLFGVAVSLVIFFQFWLLTGIFPIKFILILLAAGFLGSAIYNMVGAIAGFTLKSKKEKITGLSFIYGAKSYKITKVLNPVVLILFLVSIVGSIWVYWKYPAGSADRIVWVAIFGIMLIQLMGLIFEIVISWPIVASEYVDDDLRNSYLASKFSTIISSTLTLLFPIWVIKNEFSSVLEGYNITLPSFWFLLSIPLILFLITSLFPFFIGMYKYRSQIKAMLEWRKNWLVGMIKDIKLPKGEVQKQKLNERINRLEIQIKKELDENDVLKFYKDVVNTGFKPPESKWEQKLKQLGTIYPSKQATNEADQVVSISGEEEHQALMRKSELENILDESASNTSYFDLDDQAFKVIDYLNSQKANLKDWDLRTRNIDSLLNIYKLVKTVPPTELKEYLEADVANIEADKTDYKKSKNVLAGTFLSIASSVIIWLFKTFEDDIMNAVKSLI